MYNPYGEKNSTNEELKKKYNLPDNAEWVYFIGCTSNYRQQQIRDATLNLMKKAGINFTLIDEHCCTSPMLRTGQNDAVIDFMNYNIDKIKDVGATKVFTSCAGCYRTLLKDYEKLGAELGFEVFHTTEVIKQLLDGGKIKINSKYNTTVTYHDPCHLGRHTGVYDEPRRILSAIPGIELIEMEWNRKFSKCCGAGGGFRSGRPEDAIAVAAQRVKEAESTGASILVTACPFCLRNLSDGAKSIDSDIEVRTIESLVAQQL